MESPESALQATLEKVRDDVGKFDQEGIIGILTVLPMMPDLEALEEDVKESLAKSGNGQAEEADAFEKELVRMYGLHFQLAGSIVYAFFSEAIRQGKISGPGVIAYLKSTWIGLPFERNLSGTVYPLSIADVLEEAVSHIFTEFGNGLQNPTYVPSLVTVIDSLTMRSAYLLRYFLFMLEGNVEEDAGDKPSEIWESSFETLLEHPAIQENLLPEDRFFMKYLLVEEGGPNLRYKVGHGLMDRHEYAPVLVVLLLSMVLKFAYYQFSPVDAAE